MKDWKKELLAIENEINDIDGYDYSGSTKKIMKKISSLLLSQRKEVIGEVIKEIKFEYGDYAKIDDLITRLKKLK